MTRAACVVVTLVTLFATSCAGEPKSAAPSSRDGATLVVAEQTEPNSLNPLLLQGTTSSMVGGILYSFLLTKDQRGNDVPDAATAVPTLANGGISRDGLRITYHLRPGIRWSDGKLLSAHDCVFTFKAIVNPRTNVPDRYGYDRIVAVLAPNDRTVVVRLAKPFSPIVSTFLTMASNYPILPQHTLGSLSDLNHAEAQRPIVGSGPYTLVEWRRGDHITFAANPTYFRGRPHIGRLVMRFVPAPATIVDRLRTGEVDAALDLTDPALLAQLTPIAGKRVVVTPASGLITVYFNMQSGLTSDARLREAIADAVDSETIVNHATHGMFHSADALRAQFGNDALPNQTHADAATAKAILDAAGWRAGPGGVRMKDRRQLSLSLLVNADSQLNNAIALQLEQQLGAVGIDVHIRSYSAAMLRAPAASGGPLFGGHFDLVIAGIYEDAGPYAAQFFVCSERAPAGFNLSRTCDPQIDALFADILAASDPQRRDTDTRAIERRLAVDRPQLPLMQVRTISVIPARLRGFRPVAVTPYVNLWEWSL